MEKWEQDVFFEGMPPGVYRVPGGFVSTYPGGGGGTGKELDAEERFRQVVRNFHAKGKFPGPAAINRALERTRTKIKGRGENGNAGTE